MSIFKKYHNQGYAHLDDLENGGGHDIQHDPDFNNSSSSVQYNYVPQHGYFFPGSGMNFVIGIDGHRTLVQQKKLTKPMKFMGALFCPCFTAEEPFSEESKIRYRNCLMSFTFLFALAQAVFLGVMLKDGVAPLRENTSFGPSHTILIADGAKVLDRILFENQIWRLFSSIFMHAGVLHAIVNLAILFRLGMFLEREWGSILFLLSYFVTGLGGTVLSCILQPHTIGVGASTAVAGMVGAYGIQIALSFKALDGFQRRLQLFQFITFFLMLLVLMLCPFVDWSGIVGGGVTGILLGTAIWDLREERNYVNERRFLWIVPSILLMVGFSGAFCYLFLVMA